MRRRGRVCAFQILYQLDTQRELRPSARTGSAPPRLLEAACEGYFAHLEHIADDDRAFAERLVRGVGRELGAIDATLAAASHNWKLHRMDRVDRSLLRLAAYEMLYCADVPRAVSINEALEIAKAFSEGGAAAFVNGVLDQLVPPLPASAPAAGLGDALDAP